MRTAFQIVSVTLAPACVFAALAMAESPPTTEFLLADGERITGNLIEVSNGRATLESTERTFASGEWLRWGHPSEPPRRPRVHFSDSTWLVTKKDWAGKVPIRIVGDTVTIENELLGNVKTSRQQTRCLLFAAAKEPAVARRLLAEANESIADADRVWLVDGDLLKGQVVRFDGTRLEFLLGDKPAPIFASRVAAVAFARQESPRPKATKPAYLVGLSDGSLLEAETLSVDPSRMVLTAMQGLQLASKRKESLAYVQSLAPEIVYLSDFAPAEFRHTPYFQTSWPLTRDVNLTGEPLRASGRRYAKGLAMHSAARAVYRVPKGAGQFCADVAMDDSASGKGSVVFRVYLFGTAGAGQGGLTQAYESPVVRGGETPRAVRVDLDGASAVVLMVDYADFGDELDHADWLDARFVR